jgi:probable HAF family extracellular repeat protein
LSSFDFFISAVERSYNLGQAIVPSYRRLSLVLFAASLIVTAPAVAQTGSVINLGVALGDSAAFATAVNADGSVVVGMTGLPNSLTGHALRWTAATGMVDIGIPPPGQSWNYSAAYGVSADGSVVAGAAQTAVTPDGGGQGVAFVWQSTTGVVVLSNLGLSGSAAYAVSADGTTVVGISYPGIAPHAALWVNGGAAQDLGVLCNCSSIGESFAYAVSADGFVVVGKASISVNNYSGHAFRWTQATGMVDLGALSSDPTARSVATSVSADGSVVVGWSDVGSSPNFTQHIFRWTQADGIVDITPNGYDSAHGTIVPISISVDASGSIVYGAIGGTNVLNRWTITKGWQNVQDLLMAAGIELGGCGPTFYGISANGQYFTGQEQPLPNDLAACLVRYVDGSITSSPATHDFNDDGKSDIAWRDGSGNTAIWLMNGTAVLNQNSSFVSNVPGQWGIVGQRDFNGDGKADLLWRDTGGNVAIWEMNGTAVLNASSSFVANVPGNWSIVGTGDFNGDGMGDFLWQDTSGNRAIWEMNGTTILNRNSSFVANVPSQWLIKGSGDFNGDGKADILWQDSSGNVAIWEMNGTTILNQNSSFVAAVPGQWSIKGTGDFNGDGNADILWQDSSGNVAIWEMNGTTILNQNTSYVANVPGQWSIQLTGDFNGDGMSDILWQDTSGNVAIWEMNGTGILNASSSFVANVPGQWSIQHLAAE